MKRVFAASGCFLCALLLTYGMHQLFKRSASALSFSDTHPRSVVINEVAWMGTDASSWHEWVELYNTGAATVSLNGWKLAFLDSSPSTLTLSGEIAPHGFFLLEGNDRAISDIAADMVYGSGSLIDNDAGQVVLYAADGMSVDVANAGGGPWPAGSANAPKRTMERIDPLGPGGPSNWCTNDGRIRNGRDADGNLINGTPRAYNSCYLPPAPDLSLSLGGVRQVKAGNRVTFQISLSNTGYIAAEATVLTHELPAQIVFLGQASPFPYLAEGNRIVWQLGSVSPNVSHTVVVTGQVLTSAFGAYLSQARVLASSPERILDNNYAGWRVFVSPAYALYVPVILRAYTPPRYGVLIEAVLYDGLQLDDKDEAVLLVNGLDAPADVSGWTICRWVGLWSCGRLQNGIIPPRGRLWAARDAEAFRRSFGFEPELVVSGWKNLANEGDEVVLFNAVGALQDAVVYGDGTTGIDGWQGEAIRPYTDTGFAREGQILYRWAEEWSGLPLADTDRNSDWAQFDRDPWRGRRVRYPGWDLERFYLPASASNGVVRVGIAPDNAYQLVVDTIRSAQERIEIEAYVLEHRDLVNELVSRAQNGVSVTVLLEGGPVGGLSNQERWACQQLHTTGRGLCYAMVNSGSLRIDDRYAFLHTKMILVDRAWLVVGSQNFTHGDLPNDNKANGTGGSRGVVLATNAPGIVRRAVEIFEADCAPGEHVDITLWSEGNLFGFGPPPSGFTPASSGDWVSYTVQFPQPLVGVATQLEIVSAPESALRSSDSLLGLVARAGVGHTVSVEQMVEAADWGDPQNAPNLRLEAYLAAARRGARVRILLNGGNFGVPGFSNADNIEAVERLNQIARAEWLDLEARLGDPTHYGIHNKMVLVDLGAAGQCVHVGSINGTEASSKVNREVALQLCSPDVYAFLMQMFEYDWTH